MAEASLDAQLEGLYSRLDAQLKGGQFKKALKSSDDILKLSPGTKDAVACKAVILIELSRFEEAVEHIDGHAADFKELSFEKAYSLFRLQKFEEALAAVQQNPEDRAVARLNLQAQLHYRMGGSAEAIRIYHQLFKDHKVSSLDLRTNVLAAYVSGNRAHEVPAVMEAMKISSKDSFEIGFNTACGLLAAGDYVKARSELEHAQRLGRETLLDEDLTDEQIEDELAPVTVQLAYASSQLGNPAETLSTYEGMLSGGTEDEAVKAVATNNWVANSIASDAEGVTKKSAIELLKRFEASFDRGNQGSRLKDSLTRRLSEQQQAALYSNYSLLLLAAGRLDAARDIVNTYEKRYPDSEELQMAAAAVLAREAKQQEALALVANARSRNGALLRAQLALEAGDTSQALIAIQKAGPAGFMSRPAVLATHLALLEAAEDLQGARSLAQSSLQAADQSKGHSASIKAVLYETLARVQLKLGDVKEASQTYDKAVKQTGGDAPGLYKLMGQLARHSTVPGSGVSVETLESSLAPAESLPAGKLDDLEEAAPGSWVARRRAAEEAARKSEQSGQPQAKKKRKRKVRHPKDFDPANPGPMPHPERWLPKWQRSDFKKRRKTRKEKQEGVKGSQGAGKVDEALDRSNVVTEETDTGPERKGPPAGARSKKKGRK
ncbi:g1203 [Coccomyxa viridis]|uniref:Signal recognition particle subunit SRP72 n=1 Tax=Coccomyxa viridis TaxID=1274662 RepID=A0ABP1FKD8_9CHLO